MSNEDLQLIRVIAEVLGLLGGAWVIAQRVGTKILKMVGATQSNTEALTDLTAKLEAHMIAEDKHMAFVTSTLALHNDRITRLEGAAGVGRTLNQGGPL